MESAKQKTSEEYAVLKAEKKSSREAMLQAIQKNQPSFVQAPVVPQFAPYFTDVLLKYSEVLTGIGGRVYVVNNHDEMIQQINHDFATAKRMVSFDKDFAAIAEIQDGTNHLHQFENVEVCIITANLAVAENGAVWITEYDMPERVLPFITQSLVVIIYKENIVATLHDAYDKIGNADYSFATFIAGPSKTADIEQSLVLGAHGPKTMTVFILDKSE